MEMKTFPNKGGGRNTHGAGLKKEQEMKLMIVMSIATVFIAKHLSII
jgi:hypothetical protein